jgi:hypothetical protein
MGLFADLDTPPYAGGSFNWTDPASWMGWPTRGSVQQNFLEANPSAAYQRLLGQLGQISQDTPFARYATSQRDDAYQTYLARLAGMGDEAQNYNYTDFLSDWGPKLSQTFQMLSPTQRGEKFGGGLGRSRWIGWPS